jgi:hypothetical protein
METNATNAAVLIFNMLTRHSLAVTAACFLVVIGIIIFGHSQGRAARRRYERAIQRHMQAGGAVMMVRHGKHWLPIPVPRQDRGGWGSLC